MICVRSARLLLAGEGGECGYQYVRNQMPVQLRFFPFRPQATCHEVVDFSFSLPSCKLSEPWQKQERFFSSAKASRIPLYHNATDHISFLSVASIFQRRAVCEKYAHYYPRTKGILVHQMPRFLWVSWKDHTRGDSTNAIMEKSCCDIVEYLWSDNRLA